LKELPLLPETGQKETGPHHLGPEPLSAKLRKARENRTLEPEPRNGTECGGDAWPRKSPMKSATPIAAMRLPRRNALAKLRAPRRRVEFSLQEIRRLDDLLERPARRGPVWMIEMCPVQLRPWPPQRLDALHERAQQARITLTATSPDADWVFDERRMTRALTICF